MRKKVKIATSLTLFHIRGREEEMMSGFQDSVILAYITEWSSNISYGVCFLTWPILKD